jgi:hypothetical protein
MVISWTSRCCPRIRHHVLIIHIAGRSAGIRFLTDPRPCPNADILALLRAQCGADGTKPEKPASRDGHYRRRAFRFSK